MTKHIPLALCLLSLSVADLVCADEVILKNGSRLVGDVIKKDGSSLEFKTPFAGTLNIKWENILKVTTDKPVKVMLEDNSTQMVNTFKNEDEILQINNDSESPVQIKQSEMAYINPEPWRLGEGYKVSGNINVSLKTQHGNTDKDEFDLDGNITFRRINDRLKFSGEYENDKKSNVQADLNWLFLSKYDYFINDKTFFGGTALFEHDEFADLDLRETYGLHLGHQYFESKAINLSVEAGFAQVYENFYKAEDGDFFAGTWGVNYDQYFFDEFVQLYHRQLGRLNLEDTDKFIFKSWTGLRFPLAFGFSVSGEIEADHDSQPPPSTHRTDTTYRFKLGYDF